MRRGYDKSIAMQTLGRTKDETPRYHMGRIGLKRGFGSLCVR